jgi:phenylpyruvate tautomerase PptA (4-oxalocrotonate tautomerase family)
MPYLQLDTPFSHTAEEKRRLARRLGEIYSTKMHSNINRLSVAIRELGDGGLWRCGDGAKDPRPAAVLMCDIRKGRSAELRGELAAMLIEACQEILGLKDDNINLEFTQHNGDEMYHTLYGGLSDDWVEGEPDKIDAGLSGSLPGD